jgi:redox-sensitive bicupin YhaK (pirin superfamily)
MIVIVMKTLTDSTITLRRSEERGHMDHGWLNTYHSFSFADYYDPAHMGFRSLRVINDDKIGPGVGFPTHPHRDMEIFSYVLAGKLQHKDSLGNERVLEPGQVQVMSAGKGVLHSEFNPSETEPVHLLQLWIQPNERGLKPRYSEWHPKPGSEKEPKVLIISADGRDDSATIAQDASVYRIRLQPGETVAHDLASGRGAWLQIALGSATLNGHALATGDAGSSTTAGLLTITGGPEGTEALLFDLA